MLLHKILEQNGFTAKEAKIYLSALELGNAPASSIARKAGENRVTTYTVLKGLCKKGYAFMYNRSGTNYFYVIKPSKLINILEEKRNKLREAIPMFDAISNKVNNDTKVEYFEGENAVYTQFFDLLNTEKILSFYSYDNINENLQKKLMKNFLPKRIEKGIFAKVLYMGKEDNEYFQLKDKEINIEKIAINNDVFKLKSNIDIYGENKVAIRSFVNGEMYGVIVHSKNYFDTMTSIFETIRDMAKQLQNNTKK